MRMLLAVMAGVGLSTVPAMACNADLFTVQDWRVIEDPENHFFPYRLEVDAQYKGQRGYRMIHGGVIFADLLGGQLGQVNMERDAHVAPGDAVLVDGYVTLNERIAKVNRDDVEYRTCVWSIVYDDGTTETFK